MSSLRSCIDPMEPRLLLTTAAAVVDADGILHVRGTSKSDVITVSRSGEQIVARVGTFRRKFDRGAIKAVFVQGRGGDDRIEMRAGLPSTLAGDDGSDGLFGGPAADHFRGGEDYNEVHPNTPDDVIDFSDVGAQEILYQMRGIFYGNGSDQFDYQMDKPFLILGSPGDDRITISTDEGLAGVTVDGGEGNDSIDLMSFYDGADIVEGYITLIGGPGDDQFYLDRDSLCNPSVDCGPGDDYVREGDEDAMQYGPIDGGPGKDTVDMSPFYQESSEFSVPPDRLSSGENTEVIIGPYGDPAYVLEGNDSDNEIYATGRVTVLGFGGNDLIATDFNQGSVLNGGEGDDTLISGRRDPAEDSRSAPYKGDTLIGGAGTDTADYSRALTLNYDGANAGSLLSMSLDPVTKSQRITLDNKSNDGFAGEKDNVMADVENIFGGAGDDYLQGNPFPNSLVGNAGNDTLWAGSGNDTLAGGSGRDQLFGQAGTDLFDARDGAKDSLDGGSGSDTARRDKGPTIFDQVTGLESFIA